MIPVSNKVRDRRIVRGRLALAGGGVLLLAAVLVARLAYLQIASHQRFSTLAQNNRIDFVPIAPVRGLIHDRNGRIVAENRRVYNLEILPDQVDDIEQLLNQVGQLIELEAESVGRFRSLLARRPSFERQTLRTDLNELEAARIAVHQHRMPGLELQARLQRHYPHAGVAAHLIGYVGRITADDLRRIEPRAYRGLEYLGRAGLEAQYENLLRGGPGLERVETNAHGKVVRSLGRDAPATGLTVHLGLDIELQRVSVEALRGWQGAIVAIEPASGDILAFASEPNYDPNPFVNGISRADYQLLLDSPQRPLLNRALYGRYAPGSTVKGFVLLTGLQHGIDPNRQIYCPGWFRLPGRAHRYRDWKEGGHGLIDARDAIVQSCDIYFYRLARRLGIDALHRGLSGFGFGQVTGVDLPGEPSGLMPSPAWKHRARGQAWFPGETVITGIGQGYMLVTPLQLAAATAALANRGRRVAPRFLTATEDPRNRELQPVAPLEAGRWRVGNRAFYEYLIDGMRGVVHDRNGSAAGIRRGLKYPMAGKTGTAQVKSIPQDEKYVEEEVERRFIDHSLFIGFAPIDAPKIAVAVVVEHGGPGSRTAAPIARRVMDFYLLQQLGMFGGPDAPAAAASADSADSTVAGRPATVATVPTVTNTVTPTVTTVTAAQ